MRSLPPLVAGRRRWVLPMADATAAALVELFLNDDPDRRGDNWLALLTADPPLAVWTAIAANRAGDPPPKGLADLARWLSAHGLQALQWAPGEWQTPEPSVEQAAEAQARIARTVAVADLAAWLAAGHGSSAVELATLLGLMHHAASWNCGPETPDDVRSLLPEWLLQSAEPSAAAPAAVMLAARVLDGSATLSDSSSIDLADVRRRGDEAGRRWMATPVPAADWLPSITAKLARLTALQEQFDLTVREEKLRAMAEFAAGAGHEINNPLAVIAGRAQLFLRQQTDPELRRALALINAQAMRVYEMIADMRLFACPPQPQHKPIDLVELIDRVIDETRPAALEQKTALRRSTEVEPLLIEADAVQLGVALRAICQNALEALGHEGNVELRLRRVGAEAEIAVADDGPGISPEEYRHLFDPFYSARQAGRGLGMGLAKCWRIVTQHGGRITVDSAPGRGATFTIRLPIDR